MCTYSGLDSGVKLDISSDVGTGVREGKKRAVILDDRLKCNCSNYILLENKMLLNTAPGIRLEHVLLS